MRIGFIAGTLGQGGAERQLLYMVRALKALRADVRVYCPYQGEHYESKLIAEKVPVISLGHSSNDILRFARLVCHLFAFRPHVIQAAHFHMNLVANLLGRMLGVVCLSASRSDFGREIQTCKAWGLWGVRTANVLVTNSTASKDKAIGSGVPADKVVVLPNVVDLQEFDRTGLIDGKLSGPREAIWAAAVGTLSRNKRFDHLLLALSSAFSIEPRLYGFLVGDGTVAAELHSLARALELGDRFKFLGRRDDVPALLRHAGLFVLSSEFEGCPNVLLEAMAARLPVITTPAGDAAELVKSSQAGFVVNHEDTQAMMTRLVQLARDPELRFQLGANGRRFVETHHDAANLGAKLLGIYRFAATRSSASCACSLRNCLANT